MLQITDVDAGYGRLQVLHGVTLAVPKGKVVSLLGGNGAGKTTTLRTIAGLMPASRGTVEFAGHRIERQPAHRVVALGLALVAQGRELFPDMTVRENLELAGLTRGGKGELAAKLDEVLDYFPRLRERARQDAGTLSGGEQQMLAIGRALMSRPELLAMDEPSAGLAPIVVREIGRIIRLLNERGHTILLVEQNVRMALHLADYLYVMRNGRIVVEGEAATFSDRDSMFRSYIG